MSELKKCPCCGGDQAYSVLLQGETWIKCNCGVRFSARPYKNMVFDTWNRRPLEDALSKRVEELERTVDDLRGELAQSDRVSDATRISELESALNEILECEVITDCGDYSSGETGYECEEVKKIVREALKGWE